MVHSGHIGRMLPSLAPTTKARRGRPPGRALLQKEALLAAAILQINTEGAGSIVLADMGARLGISRSSLYYYFRDAADLISQAYLKGCAVIAGHTAAAVSLQVPADQQVADFVGRALAQGGEPIAALNDVDYLPEEMQTEVRAANEQNVAALATMLRGGQAAGVFRAFDAALVAQLILSNLSWTLVSLPWMDRVDEPGGRDRRIRTICDLLLNGIAPAGAVPQPCDIRYDPLVSRSINAFDRRQTADLKAEQIIDAASRLFNLKGLDGVRLDDISAEIGASKGAVYHHFRDKVELIERCYDRAFDIYEMMMETAISSRASYLDRAIVATHLNAQAQLSNVAPLALQPGLNKLSGSKRTEFSKRTQRLSEQGSNQLAKGVADGSCRKFDAEVAPDVFAGYFTGLRRWAPARVDPTTMADFVIDIAVFGLRTR
jgi:AcrR family transcriptional regulator